MVTEIDTQRTVIIRASSPFSPPFVVWLRSHTQQVILSADWSTDSRDKISMATLQNKM